MHPPPERVRRPFSFRGGGGDPLTRDIGWTSARGRLAAYAHGYRCREATAPPRLVGLPPAGFPILDDDRRRRAGREWADWWQALLEVEGREQADADEDDDSPFWAWAEDLGRVWDAPE